MQPTFTNYNVVTYIVPFGIFVVLLVCMSIINERAHAFLIQLILGIKLKHQNSDEKKSKEELPVSIPQKKSQSASNNSQKPKEAFVHSDQDENKEVPEMSGSSSLAKDLEANVETFLYVEPEEKKKALPCLVRFLCDAFGSAILAVLAEIIFEKCVLSSEGAIVGNACPDFKADCFGTYNGTVNFGPYQCTPGQNASFPVTSMAVYCFGWTYDDVTTRDVLDTIGVTAGLMGLIACIIPLVYYLSYFKKRYWWMSIFCIIIPLGTFGSLIFVIIHTLPAGPTVLTDITFAILLTMTLVGWIWAFVSSCYSKPGGCNVNCACFNRCGKRWCLRSYSSYPWCCCCNKEDSPQRRIQPLSTV